jgi:hypothetical protein
MPPRYAYWTILVDEQPTAFRSGSQEELMPTFKRLQAKNATAKMMWWQNGKLWNSRLDAQEAMRARGEMGRRGDDKQFGRRREEGGGFRSRNQGAARRDGGSRFGGPASAGPKPRDERDDSGKLAWKPKSDAPVPDRGPRERSERPQWKPKGAPASGRPPRPEWKSKPQGDRRPRADWNSRSGGGKPEWRPKSSSGDSRSKTSSGDSRLEWKPKGSAPSSRRPAAQAPVPDGPRRKWVPKEEYKKSQAPGEKPARPRDKNWRPGGEHKDPRQKYKDAKKAKWGRFKQNIRQKWETRQGGRKKPDDK